MIFVVVDLLVSVYGELVCSIGGHFGIYQHHNATFILETIDILPMLCLLLLPEMSRVDEVSATFFVWKFWSSLIESDDCNPPLKHF